MSGVPIDLKGKRFGQLRVIRRSRDSPSGQPRWLCKCKCGNKCIVDGRNLRSGQARSCGCVAEGEVASMTTREKRASSESVVRLRSKPTEPYQDLANAIICVAADDYRIAMTNGNVPLLDEIESFFGSEWYRVLTSTDPKRLLRLLRQEHDNTLAVAYI